MHERSVKSRGIDTESAIASSKAAISFHKNDTGYLTHLKICNPSLPVLWQHSCNSPLRVAMVDLVVPAEGRNHCGAKQA